MSENSMYDLFSENYDRFVDWESRLSSEIPFLAAELNKIRKNTSNPIAILDAACGTGHHAIALAEQGFRTAGADFSKGMVEHARRNALQAKYDIPFERAGFGQLAATFGENTFDGLICLGNSLPHVLDKLSLANTLADFRAVIREGGKLIIQNRNFDMVLEERSRWMPPQTHQDGDETWLFARFYDFDPDGRLTFNIQILHNKQGSNFKQQVVSTRLWPMERDIITKFITEAGYIDLKYFGDLAGSEFDIERSGNLVLTATA